MFIHLSDDDQAKVSKWLAETELTEHINIYFYDHEIEIPWLLYALSKCEYKYIDLDRLNTATDALSGHILGKNDIYYKINDENLSAIYHYINQNRISSVENFLQKALNEKIRPSL
jgi:hypothetical protein